METGTNNNLVERVAREAWKPIDTRPPWKWAEDHIVIDKTSPFAGKFRSETAPWTKKLMEVFADNRVNDISVMCSAQSSKTQTIMILLAWAIAEDPAPAMWVMAAQDEAKTFCQTRLMPTFADCKPVADLMPTGRGGVRSLEIDFASMPLVVNGANSPSKLQSKPIRWLFLDEVRNYPDGALEMALKRTRAFWNARRVIISTPDMENDAVHMAFLSGDQQHLYVSCPECKHKFILAWECIKWDDTEFTRPNGVWAMDHVAETIRCECPKCEHRIYDTPQDRRKLAKSGEWISHNPTAPKNRVSFTWNALIPTWVRWRDLVEEFIDAHKALTWKDHTKLKSFVNESLGQPWSDKLKDIRDWRWVEERKANYQLREHWSGEHRRFLTVDVQKDHLWYLCRAWAKGGASRLIDFGRVWNFDELRQVQRDLRVADDDVAIDSGYNASMVYAEVVKSNYQWKAFKGDRAAYYSHGGLRRCWTFSQADPAIGTSEQGRVRPVRLFIWSNHLTKDTLAMHMRGLSAPWDIPEGASQEYLDQITAESREQIVSAKGVVSYEWVRLRKDNHAFDLECMNLICAMVTKITEMPKDTDLLTSSIESDTGG
jgi:phage terminase large subunit GpA-like protein